MSITYLLFLIDFLLIEIFMQYILIMFIFETGSHYMAQASLALTGWSRLSLNYVDAPTSALKY